MTTYTHSLPPAPSFDGKGLFGYSFGPLQKKDVDVYYVVVDGGHDTFMVSRRITRIYYVLEGTGYFTIEGRRHDVSSGMLVEVPPKVEYSYSGRMKLVVFASPAWSARNDTHTRWNWDAIGEEFFCALAECVAVEQVAWAARVREIADWRFPERQSPRLEHSSGVGYLCYAVTPIWRTLGPSGACA